MQGYCVTRQLESHLAVAGGDGGEVAVEAAIAAAALDARTNHGDVERAARGGLRGDGGAAAELAPETAAARAGGAPGARPCCGRQTQG